VFPGRTIRADDLKLELEASGRKRLADALSALDLALDKIDRQVVKYKEKVTHRKKPISAVRVPAQDGEEARSPEPERIRLKLRPMTVSEAVAELEADGNARALT